MGAEYSSAMHQIIHSKQERLEFCDCYYFFRIHQKLKSARNFRQMLMILGKSKVKNSWYGHTQRLIRYSTYQAIFRRYIPARHYGLLNEPFIFIRQTYKKHSVVVINSMFSDWELWKYHNNFAFEILAPEDNLYIATVIIPLLHWRAKKF